MVLHLSLPPGNDATLTALELGFQSQVSGLQVYTKQKAPNILDISKTLGKQGSLVDLVPHVPFKRQVQYLV